MAASSSTIATVLAMARTIPAAPAAGTRRPRFATIDLRLARACPSGVRIGCWNGGHERDRKTIPARLRLHLRRCAGDRWDRQRGGRDGDPGLRASLIRRLGLVARTLGRLLPAPAVPSRQPALARRARRGAGAPPR